MIGEQVQYSEDTDDQGRARAKHVNFSGKSGYRIPRILKPLVVPLAFFALLSWLVSESKVPIEFLYVYFLASFITLLVYGWDKWSAKRQRSRVSEQNLHLLALAGGWPGALVAQHLFHHKSSKKPFLMMFWFTVMLNIGGLIWFLTPSGQELLKPFAAAISSFLKL